MASPCWPQKNENIKKGKYIILKSRYAYWIKGYRPLWRAHEVLIPSLCINNSWTLIFKIRRLSFFGFSNVFLQINIGGDSRAFSFLEDALLLFASPSRQRVGCNRWRLHWGLVKESSHSINVQCFIVTSSLFILPLLFSLLFCP